jgi:hypothetical protein
MRQYVREAAIVFHGKRRGRVSPVAVAIAGLLFGAVSARADRVLVLQPSVIGTTVSGAPARACAGGILDSVHEAQVQLTATNPDGTPLPGLVLNLSWTGNQGHNYGNGQPLKTAHFLDANGNIMNDANGVPLDEISVTTDGNGNAPVNAVSGDVVCKPNVVIEWNGNQVGAVPFDFGAPESRRHFGIKQFHQGYDSDYGWDFQMLVNPGDDSSAVEEGAMYVPDAPATEGMPPSSLHVYRGEVFLKFSKNKNYVADTTYFDAQGNPLGSASEPLDAGNYVPAPGHNLAITLHQVVVNSFPFGAAGPANEATVFFCDADGVPEGGQASNGQPQNSMQQNVVTGNDGVGVFYIEAGPELMMSGQLTFQAVDLSVHNG